MTFAISLTAICPLRSDPSHRGEMVSQLLFGEAAEVIDKAKDFTKLRCLYDDYIGWAQTSQLIEADRTIALRKPLSYTFRRNATIAINGTEMYVPVGTPIFSDVIIGNYSIQYPAEDTLLFEPSFYTEDVIKMVSLLYENVPYLWGGKSSFGIDCSGYVQQVAKLFGKPLLRDAYQQVEVGEVVHFLQEARCGDLAYFDNEEGRIVHVGILLNANEIIHASGKVRIDDIDSFGILNRDTGARTHKLRVIKRI